MLEDNGDGRERQYEQDATQSSPAQGDGVVNPQGEIGRETWEAPGAVPRDPRADHVEHVSNPNGADYGEVY